MWGDAGFWLSVDPLVDKYIHQSPYLYCNGNPIMLVDPDGRSFCDKVVGFGMGVFTNAIPCLSSLRDSYTPDDRDDYNAGLLTADLISGMTGAYLTAAGVADVGVGCSEIFGGGCVALSVVGAPEGALVAGGGCVLVLKGTGEVAAGNYLMSQASINIGQGYNRGQRKGDGTTDTSKFKNSRRLTDTELNQYFGSPNWHKNGSKTSLVKKFSKELKGDTNVDIYVDKKSKQIYLKGNKSGTWVDTGDVLDF